MSLVHFVLQFTKVSSGVCGVIWLNMSGIHSVLAIFFICRVYVYVPMGVFLWCMHNICIARLSVLGSILNSGRIVDSS